MYQEYVCGKIGIQVPFKGGNTIKCLLVVSKNRDNVFQKRRIIYRYMFSKMKGKAYIRESARIFWERYKEHLRDPSSIYDHAKTSIHHSKFDNLSLVVRRSHTMT